MPPRVFIVPREIIYGQGALDSLANVPAKRALIVTDKGVVASGNTVERVQKVLQTKNVESRVFDGVEHDPSKGVVWSLFATARDFGPDLLIGLGGGSSIDSAKAAWVLYEHPDWAALPFTQVQRQSFTAVLRQKARLVAIPTTSGTGSEVTRAAIVTDTDEKPPYKAVFASAQLVPDVAILDPSLPASMPPDVTANTGYDAFVHAVECYVLSEPSDLVDAIALRAARVVLDWLPKAVANGKDMEARDRMHLAAMNAGMAFSNGRLGLVHGLAHQIGAGFGIPHGRANAFMLCAVFAYLYPSYKARFISLAENLGCAGPTDAAKVDRLLALCNNLKRQVGIPLAIKDSGLKPDVWSAGVGPETEGYWRHMQPAALQMTPEARRAAGSPATADDVRELFWHAWNGTHAEIK